MLRYAKILVASTVIAVISIPTFADETAKVAHIKLSGSLGESPGAASPFGGESENLRAKLDRIKKAAEDKEITALYVEISGIGAGYGKTHEIITALKDFRETGKRAYAYLNSSDLASVGGTKDYLVACACDEIGLPESGSLPLIGVRMEVSLYKDLFDLFHLKADMMQMGDFKGAGETYTRSTMSDENRQQWEAIVDGHYSYLVNGIAEGRKSRGFSVDKVKQIIDEGPYTARRAVKVGLVDSLAYQRDFEGSLKKSVSEGKVEIVRNYGKPKKQALDMSNPFAMLRMLTPPAPKKLSKKPKVALIYAEGAIMTGKSGMSFLGGQTMGSTTMVEAIRKAEEEETVKAIVLRIDSPGGSALASDLIWKELMKSKKPVIASMSDVAGSGGYYIAMPANRIFAEPGTITGSIGVVGGKIVVGGLMERVGINTEVVSRGANSGAMSIYTPFTPGERKAMRAMMEDVYDQFLSKTIEGRKRAGKEFTREGLLKLAGGRIYTGQQAIKNGLVDEIGTLDDALASAKTMAGLGEEKDVELLVLPRPQSFLDSLMEGFSFNPFAKLVQQIQIPLPELLPHARAAGALLQLRQDRVWTMIPYYFEVK